MTALVLPSDQTIDLTLQRKQVRQFSSGVRRPPRRPCRPNDQPSQSRQNRFQHRASESLHLWPSYELFIRHPSVPNFYLLPAFFEEQSMADCHSSWEPSYHFIEYRPYPSPPFYLPQTPQTPPRSHSQVQAAYPHMTPKTIKTSRSKRKLETLFDEDQFLMNDRELSVFLDFDNV
jgi:hypothetical protein